MGLLHVVASAARTVTPNVRPRHLAQLKVLLKWRQAAAQRRVLRQLPWLSGVILEVK